MEEVKSTIVTVPQLVDLALNSPEIGIVNFTIMHSLLHVMVHQLQLSDCSVEFRGSDSVRLQNYIKTAKPGPLIALKEYYVGGAGEETPEKGQVDEAKPEKVAEASSKTVVVVEPTKQETNQQFTVGITQQQYQNLMADMDSLKEQVKELNDLPGNIGLLEAIRTPTAPVQEMFHLMSMNKKVDAHEITLKKLSTLIEDLILEKKGEGPLMEIMDFNESDLDKIRKRLTSLEEQMNELAKMKREDNKSKGEVKEQKEVRTTVKTTIDHRVRVLNEDDDYDTRLKTIYDELVNMNETYQESFRDIERELNNIKDYLSSNLTPEDKSKDKIKSRMISSPSMPALFSKVSVVPTASAMTQVIPSELMDLVKKVKMLEGSLTVVTDMTQILWDERPGKQALMEMVQQTVELLKNLKADREEIEEALQAKADTCMLETLVPKEEFEAVEENLMKLLGEANQKLTQQEVILQEQITSLFEEVNKKLESGELEDLKEQINQKIKILHDKLKILMTVKDETEAAGGKMKFIKNVTCLSCDKEVVMRREADANSFPKAPILGAQKSMGAYLAYELDQMRKQRKCAANAKSLNLMEHALHSRHDKVETDHICNRYCGGSHTTVTSGQKVTRLGHFLNQWDPDSSPKQDESIRGTDGKMYKGHEDPH